MIPYGYRIKQGETVIEENEANKIRELFRLYLEGLPIADAGVAAAIPLSHTAVGKILSNTAYTGLGFYPEIIPPTLFEEAQLLRAKKNRLSQSTRTPVMTPTAVKTAFRFEGLDPSVVTTSKYDAIYQSIRPGEDEHATSKTKSLIAQTLHQQ